MWYSYSLVSLLKLYLFQYDKNSLTTFSFLPPVLGLGLQGLYSATNCMDNIIGRFTMILRIKLQG